jgi:hypothetical protein
VTPELRDFLRESYALPFVWGERDCALWVADWIRRRRGVDLGAPFRGTYSSAAGCEYLLAREGGLLALASRLCAGAGLAAIDQDDAENGDMACVAGPLGPTLGLMVFRRVAMLARDGLVVSRAYRIMGAWKV